VEDGSASESCELVDYGAEVREHADVPSFGCLLIAARRVGPSGLVIGVDMTDVMVGEARRNVARAGLDNVEVRKGLIENLPVAAESVDWVISNCVINLSPQKERVFAEIARVLRPRGQFRISDIVVEELPSWIRESAAAYAACVAGAIPEAEYVAGLERAGLVDVRVEHRLVYSAAQISGLVGQDLERHGLDPAVISGAFDEAEGKVWSAYFTGRKG
jgi:SAM-dependent methyltransferase